MTDYIKSSKEFKEIQWIFKQFRSTQISSTHISTFTEGNLHHRNNSRSSQWQKFHPHRRNVHPYKFTRAISIQSYPIPILNLEILNHCISPTQLSPRKISRKSRAYNSHSRNSPHWLFTNGILTLPTRNLTHGILTHVILTYWFF